MTQAPPRPSAVKPSYQELEAELLDLRSRLTSVVNSWRMLAATAQEQADIDPD